MFNCRKQYLNYILIISDLNLLYIVSSLGFASYSSISVNLHDKHLLLCICHKNLINLSDKDMFSSIIEMIFQIIYSK